MSLGGNKPPILNELAEKVLPSLLLIFEGLKRAYHARAQEGEEEESEDEDDEDCEGMYLYFEHCTKLKQEKIFNLFYFCQKLYLATKMK